VLEDDPLLNIRDDSVVTLGRQPDRIILDTNLRVPSTMKMFDVGGQVYIFTASINERKKREIEEAGAIVNRCELSDKTLDLKKVFLKFKELEINELLVEAGARLTGSILKLGFWDELVIYIAPKIIGRGGRRALDIPSPEILSNVLQLNLKDEKVLGDNIKLVFEK